jgi:hypothetical protein
MTGKIARRRVSLRLMKPGLSLGVATSDNKDHEGVETFLDYIRNPAEGYISSPS